MHVGLYFDLRNPPAWHREWAHVYGHVLELCEESERLGAHSVWLTEHHLFEDGYVPQPLVYAAAVAARTKRVRIGTAILIPAFKHPVELAEEAAMVDILSNGRLDLGLGAGYRLPEYELFGAEHGRRARTTLERARRLQEIWAEGRVTPPPVQDPLPIWIGPRGEGVARRTGELGLGLLRVAPELRTAYLEGLAAGGHGPERERWAGPVNVFLTDDPERDWPRIAPHVAHQWNSYFAYGAEGTGLPAPPPIDVEEWRARGIDHGGTSAGFLVATPETAADRILALAEGAPVETVFLWGTLGGLDEDLAARNVELACTRLAPLLAAR